MLRFARTLTQCVHPPHSEPYRELSSVFYLWKASLWASDLKDGHLWKATEAESRVDIRDVSAETVFVGPHTPTERWGRPAIGNSLQGLHFLLRGKPLH